MTRGSAITCRSACCALCPGTWLRLLLSIVLVGTLAPAASHWFHSPGRKALQSVLLLSTPVTQPVFAGEPYPMVNGALWTIAYEFRCYLLLAAAGLLGLLRKPRLMLLAAATLLLLDNLPAVGERLAFLPYAILFGEPLRTFRLVAFFATGCCFYLYRERIVYRPALLGVAALGLVLVHFLAPAYSQASVCVFGSYALFYLGHHHYKALDRLRPLPDISYGVYLYGWPVEHLWFHYRHGSPWVLFAGSTVICLALGWLSWHLVERPMLRFKKRPTAALPPG